MAAAAGNGDRMYECVTMGPAQIRENAVLEMHRDGGGMATIASATGLSKGRVRQFVERARRVA